MDGVTAHKMMQVAQSSGKFNLSDRGDCLNQANLETSDGFV
jgi:hypothetical protein